MSTKVVRDRVDALVLTAKLDADGVRAALYEHVLRSAKVDEGEDRLVDLLRSKHKVAVQMREDGGADVLSADVTVYLDKSLEPRCLPAPTPPSADDVRAVLREWGSGTGVISTDEAVEKIRDLCR